MSHTGQERRFGRSSPTSAFTPESVQTCDLSKMVKTCRYQISLLSWLLHE